jgi:O-antigen ligase
MNKKTVKIGHTALYIVSTAYFLVIAAIFPLYITRTHYIDITGEKANFFMAATAIAASLIILTLFLTTKNFQVRNYFAANEPKRPLSIAEWAAAIFVFLALLSSIFSPHGSIVWMGEVIGRHEGFWVLLCYVLAFFIISRFYKPQRWHLLLFALGSALVSLYGILQFLDHDVLVRWGFFSPLPELGTDPANQLLAPLSRTFRTTLGNINIVSAYAAFTAVLFTWLFAGEKSLVGIVYIIPGTLAFAMLLVTQGDAGWVGIIAAMALTIPYWLTDRHRLGKILIALAAWAAAFVAHNAYLTHLKTNLNTENIVFLYDHRVLNNFTPQNPQPFIILASILTVIGLTLIFIPLKRWPVKIMKISGITLLALTIIGGFAFIQIEGARHEDNPGNIIWQAREILHGRIEDEFGSNRAFVWRESVNILTDRPILGSGPATFRWALSQEFQKISLERFGVIFDTAHNIYLNTAITLGIPALMALLTLIGSLFWQSLKKAFNRPILLAFSAAALAYLAQGFFQVDTPIDRPLIWLALGVMANEIWRGKIEKPERSE